MPVERLRAYARERGYRVVAEHRDVASGLNQNRRGLERVVKAAERGEFSTPTGRPASGTPGTAATWQKEPEDAHTELVQDLPSRPGFMVPGAAGKSGRVSGS